MQATRKAEGLESRVGVLRDIAKFVVVEALGDGAVGGVDDQPRAAEVVADDAVGDTALDHVVRDVSAAAVDEGADNLVAAVEFGDRVQLIAVEPALDEDSIDLLADTAVLSVDDVVDLSAIGQRDVAEVADDVV